MSAIGLVIAATALYALTMCAAVSLLNDSQLASIVFPDSRGGRQAFSTVLILLAPVVVIAIPLISVICLMTYVSYRLSLMIFDTEALQEARQLAQSPRPMSRQDVDEHTLETYPR